MTKLSWFFITAGLCGGCVVNQPKLKPVTNLMPSPTPIVKPIDKGLMSYTDPERHFQVIYPIEYHLFQGQWGMDVDNLDDKRCDNSDPSYDLTNKGRFTVIYWNSLSNLSAADYVKKIEKDCSNGFPCAPGADHFVRETVINGYQAVEIEPHIPTGCLNKQTGYVIKQGNNWFEIVLQYTDKDLEPIHDQLDAVLDSFKIIE